MASRTRTVNPRTKQTTQRQNSESPNKGDDSPQRRQQPKNFQHNDGFTVVAPDAVRREKIANAAAREEAQVRQHHDRRRQEIVQMLNQPGQTEHRLGGGNADMEAVRRQQVMQAEAQLRRGTRFPALSNPPTTPNLGDQLSVGSKGTPQGLNAARKKMVEQAENQFRKDEKPG